MKNARANAGRAVRHALGLLAKRLEGVRVELALVDHSVEPPLRAPFDPHADYADLVAQCDGLRLEQALINLIANALDAVSAASAPRIDIDIESDARDATLAIRVRDNGPGIHGDVLPHLFEPFFTTKEVGHGLGLGLAISSSIARDCGGSLTAHNEPDGGACFVLRLRRAGVAMLGTASMDG
jgi:two-component system C4-dicarboxylate transport sensor histidine kinase DctB